MLPDDILFSSITELATQIRARRISPIELTESYLERLDKIGKRLGAVASLMRDSALDEARAAEREIRRGRYRGPLHGIPYGAKDLLATRKAKTTWGAAPFADTSLTMVTVLNAPPVVGALAGETIGKGTTYTASGSFTDPGDDSWSATVNYGDGSAVQPLTLSGKTFALSHQYATPGSYSVTVTVRENDPEAATGVQTATA